MSEPRFLFDENLLGVGSIIRKARGGFSDVWLIGDSPCPIARGTADELWLPESARRGLVVFRADKDHLDHDTESYRAWREAGCKGFVLSLQQSRFSLWDQAQALFKNWDKIENHIRDHEGDPFWVARVTKGGVRPA